jgi:carboxylate-amine ligase
VETRVLILELLDFVDDVVDELGSRDQISYVHQILKNGTGAAKQLAVFEKNTTLQKWSILSQMNSLKAYKLLDYLYNYY